MNYINSSCTLVIFQGVNSHVCLVATYQREHTWNIPTTAESAVGCAARILVVGSQVYPSWNEWPGQLAGNLRAPALREVTVSIAVTERGDLRKLEQPVRELGQEVGRSPHRQCGSHRCSGGRAATLCCCCVQWDTDKSHPGQLNLLVLQYMEYYLIKVYIVNEWCNKQLTFIRSTTFIHTELYSLYTSLTHSFIWSS